MQRKERISFTEITTIVTSLSVLFSLSYNYGYFFNLDKRFFSFLTIQDHINSSLIHIFYIFPTLIGIYFLMNERMASLSKHKSKGLPHMFIFGYLCITVPLFAYKSYTEKIEWKINLILFLSVCWIAYSSYLYFSLKEKILIKSYQLILLLVLPSMLATMFCLGWLNQIKENNLPKTVSILIYKNSAIEKVSSLHIIRALDKGVILKSEKDYLFITWDKINQIIFNEKNKKEVVVPIAE